MKCEEIFLELEESSPDTSPRGEHVANDEDTMIRQFRNMLSSS